MCADLKTKIHVTVVEWWKELQTEVSVEQTLLRRFWLNAYEKQGRVGVWTIDLVKIPISNFKLKIATSGRKKGF